MKQDFTGTMRLFREDGFQELLQNYPRRPKLFLRAIENEDQVSSEYLIRDGLGKEHKPEDYLQMFARFVQENPAQIEAVRILLDRPADWSTEALKELQQKLSAAPERFTVNVLQKAHQLRYNKAMVDIISMVKHAATQQNPLLTATERAAAAIRLISTGRSFTVDQQRWLDLIQQHLAANLTIERDDFDIIPAFVGAGGWGKANNVFDGKLDSLLSELNRAIAA
jgi:type I restriction enzyme R subunit